MPLQLQKYLGWLQRYLYAVESGHITIPTPTIDIANEPFGYRDIRGELTSVVGNATLDFETPVDRRRLHLWGWISGAPWATALDDFQLCILRDGLTYPLWQFDNLPAESLNAIPIIRTRLRSGNAAEFTAVSHPVYVGPGETLRLILGGSVAGLVGTYRGLAIDVPAFAPFPNVF